MKGKWSGLLYLIRTTDDVVVTGQRPPEVVIDEKKGIWVLRGLPPFCIGENSFRLQYCDSPPKGPIGVFRATNVRHMQNMVACQNCHLRDILGQRLRSF